MICGGDTRASIVLTIATIGLLIPGCMSAADEERFEFGKLEVTFESRGAKLATRS